MMAITLHAENWEFVVTLVTNNALYGVSSVTTVTFGTMIVASAGSRWAGGFRT